MRLGSFLWSQKCCRWPAANVSSRYLWPCDDLALTLPWPCNDLALISTSKPTQPGVWRWSVVRETARLGMASQPIWATAHGRIDSGFTCKSSSIHTITRLWRLLSNRYTIRGGNTTDSTSRWWLSVTWCLTSSSRRTRLAAQFLIIDGSLSTCVSSLAGLTHTVRNDNCLWWVGDTGSAHTRRSRFVRGVVSTHVHTAGWLPQPVQRPDSPLWHDH